MAEEINIIAVSRNGKYKELLSQLKSLIDGEDDIIANLANICAGIKQTFGFLWVGFYLVKGEQLVLGPFQGPVACTRIGKGKGVCGTAWINKEALIVPNVDHFSGHIACSSASKSEIVLPIMKNGNVVMVLDIDSSELNDFDEVDKNNLLQVIELVEAFI